MFENLKRKILNNDSLTPEEALAVLNTDDRNVFYLFAITNEIRNSFKGSKISFCSISNAKSGKCSEDCKFCAQSSHYKTDVNTYPLKSSKKLLREIDAVNTKGIISSLGLVTSGKGILSDHDFSIICETIAQYPDSINSCASLGILTYEQCNQLKASGLKTLHHNLETAESFYPQICTTHSYQERLQTLKNAKDAGLQICCGGIFGLGESLEQRVEFAFALKDVNPEGIPINFLNPVEGTPFENNKILSPFESLKIIAMFRLVHPQKTVLVGGGREKALRSLQSLMFVAGANATITGDYLTTTGKNIKEDSQILKDLGFQNS